MCYVCVICLHLSVNSQMEKFPIRCAVVKTICDVSKKVEYKVGLFLGRGAFAKCYEFRNVITNEVFAGKIVSKRDISTDDLKNKMAEEIFIHRSLSHRNIVKFHSDFEDSENVYMILELCNKCSLMEMQRRRKTLTLPEVRYFVKQIVLACKYMRDRKIIHRDLKLGNLFLSNDMTVKVGDFGLATLVSCNNEKRRTVCGTPNYISPEVLNKNGHSFEVDIWAIGCIMYILLVGVPPFESFSLNATFSKIQNNDYVIPKKMNPEAKALIQKLLHFQPDCRPTPEQILADPFFAEFIPAKLPTSCLSMAPRFYRSKALAKPSTVRRPLTESNQQVSRPTTDVPKFFQNPWNNSNIPKDYYFNKLVSQLGFVNVPKLTEIYNGVEEDIQSPSSAPFVWITKWYHHENYGLGYELCDNSLGILYNDCSHLILLSDGQNFHYIERNGKTEFHDLVNYPSQLSKKISVLKNFRSYMKGKLSKAGDKITPKESSEEFTQLPILSFWYPNKQAVAFHLTNGTLQFNFQDHVKLIICPIMNAITYIGSDKEFVTYSLKSIKKRGCHKTLATRLVYAKDLLQKISSATVGLSSLWNR